MRKRDFYRGFLALATVFPFLLPAPLQAQTTRATITQGERGKFYVITPAGGSRGGRISADKRYVSGDFFSGETSSSGYIYDIEKDTTLYVGAATFLASPDWYAGGNCIYKEGKRIDPENRSNSSDPFYGTSSIWAASADLTKVITMAYEEETDPLTGKKTWVNYAYVVNGSTGKIIERIPLHWPMSTDPAYTNSGTGERVNACSDDATVLAGHSSMPGAYNNWSPVFWDLENDTSFFIGDDINFVGSLEAVNKDGSVIAGSCGQGSYVIYYDRENLTYTKEPIPYSPGKEYAIVADISETGKVVFLQQSVGSDPGSRQSFLYDIRDKSMVLLEDYIRELYGLEAPIPCFSASSISDDGRMIAGWSYNNYGDVPYLIVLDENQIFARPRNFQAIQNLNTMNLEMQWRVPMQGQYVLKGYDVYCDSVKLNTELIDPSVTHFIQSEGLENGVHSYAVQAVYEEGVSAFTDEFKVMVVTDGGCFPVQEIGSRVTYNRTVDVFWGLPSSRMLSKGRIPDWDGTFRASVKGGEGAGKEVSFVKSYRNDNLDVFRYVPLEGYSWSSAIVVGNSLYAADYNKNTITEFDYSSLNAIRTVEIDGISKIDNMAYWNGKIYLATEKEEILEVDMESMSVSNRLKTKSGVNVVHLTYVPELDGGDGGFAYGDWTSLQYCDKYGREIEAGAPVDVDGLVISGSAYHGGYLYLFSQSGPKYDELYTVDFKTGKCIAKKVLSNDFRLSSIEPTYGFVAGGLSVSLLPDSTAVLSAGLQFSAASSHIAFMEAASAPGLLGYNLYRNGEKMNPEGTYIRGLSYQDILFDPGTYTYTVEAVSENGCRNMLDEVKTTVTITPIGECPGPEKIVAFESNRSVCLSWDYQSDDAVNLVGFDLFRNGEQLTENLVDLKYTDSDLAKGNYVYRIEAFHDNSCVSVDSIAVEVTHEGMLMAPSAFSVEAVENGGAYDAEARWDLPYFEQPLALGYCGLPVSALSMIGTDSMYAVVAWDAGQLEAYRDLYVVGMEYFIGEQVLDLTGLVFLNDTLAYSCKPQSRISEGNWNTIMFDRFIPMDQPMEVVVGYKVVYETGAQAVAAFDLGPAKTGYSDLLSHDGQQWFTLSSMGYDYNWCINALVVKKRDLEEARKLQAKGGKAPLVRVMSVSGEMVGIPQAVESPKAGSATVKLEGFNLYRDGEKLNPEVLKDFSFTDKELSKGMYEYKVSAVYSGNGEVESESVLLDLEEVSNREGGKLHINVFPNPAQHGFHVQGNYSSLEIIGLAGTVVARYRDGRQEVDVRDLPAGTYLLRFVLENGSVEWKKIVLHK